MTARKAISYQHAGLLPDSFISSFLCAAACAFKKFAVLRSLSAMTLSPTQRAAPSAP
jgi:hypothetical protein